MTKTAPKERPIIFTAESVRAILAGRKTQTRRVVKPQPAKVDAGGAWVPAGQGVPVVRTRQGSTADYDRVACPCGAPGDRLWVRETWALGIGGPIYRADWDNPYADDNYPAHPDARWLSEMQIACGADVHKGGWRSPMFMPRKASRLTLDVVAVRVERLHEISEADVLAEGIEPIHIEKNRPFFHRDDCPGLAFGEHWNRINGKKHPWKSDPFVWVVEFRKVTA